MVSVAIYLFMLNVITSSDVKVSVVAPKTIVCDIENENIVFAAQCR